MAPEVYVQLGMAGIGLALAALGYAVAVFTDPKRRKVARDQAGTEVRLSSSDDDAVYVFLEEVNKDRGRRGASPLSMSGASSPGTWIIRERPAGEGGDR